MDFVSGCIGIVIISGKKLRLKHGGAWNARNAMATLWVTALNEIVKLHLLVRAATTYGFDLAKATAETSSLTFSRIPDLEIKFGLTIQIYACQRLTIGT
jgi:hypothetical protein